jgi:CheY-like chemotaxis protein
VTARSVLIIDDEKAILSVLKNSLNRYRGILTVFTAEDSLSGLDIVHHQQIDLVVSDYRMKGMTGIELLKAVRQYSPSTKFILMTAYGNRDLEKEAYRLNVYHYLEKPIDIQVFRQVVLSVLELSDVTDNVPTQYARSSNRDIDEILQRLLNETHGNSICLMDSSHHTIAETGNGGKLPAESILNLLVSSNLQTSFPANSMDETVKLIHVYSDNGKQSNLFVFHINPDYLMLMVVGGEISALEIFRIKKIGKQTVDLLEEMLKNAQLRGSFADINESLYHSILTELDSLIIHGNPNTPGETDWKDPSFHSV